MNGCILTVCLVIKIKEVFNFAFALSVEIGWMYSELFANTARIISGLFLT